jgi:hypothetical protein
MKKTSACHSAFFNPRVLLAFVLCSIGVIIALFGLGAFPGSSALAQVPGSPAPTKPVMQVGVSYYHDVSPALRDVLPWPVQGKEREREANLNPRIPHHHIDSPDPVVQNARVSALALLAPAIPAPIRNFDGIPFPGVGCNCAPPDTNGAVGATQYVQIVNEAYQVFDKATGNSVLGPNSIASVWTGFPGVCSTNGDGDPIVLYDHIANRWLISQFAGAGATPTDECIAISTSSDATGTYNRYGFHLGTNFFDYPKIVVWPDGYYMANNVFNAGGTVFLGTQAFAFDRAAMIAGMPLTTFLTPGLTPGGANNEAFLPADLDGPTLPPVGAPESFVEFPNGGNGNTYKIWHFHVDFAVPANSTFTVFASPAAAGYTTLCPVSSCVPNLGGGTMDGLGDRLMYRAADRFIGGHESLVANYSVNSGGVAGIRWFELRNVTSGPVTVFQESTYQPDTTWRWMGSVAMDGSGNMALGFSASSSSIHPQIRYTGRLASDPLNTLPQGEAHILDGTGSPTGSGNRWGDYSSFSVDPVDDQTLWYTTEYYTTTGTQFNWRTRVGAFKFSNVPTNLIVSGGSYIVSAGPNGVLDPGETVTVAVGLLNSGGPGSVCTTAALTGTLQASGGVTLPPGPHNYGVLCTGSPAIFRNFTFTVDPALACGSNVTASLAVVDGATNYGTITYPFSTGSQANTFAENFDGVVPPALPAGWVATQGVNGGGFPFWVTSNSGTPAPPASSVPNSAFTPDPANLLDNRLATPSLMYTAGSKLTFKHNFDLEESSATIAYDCGVLEISINGGAFADIITAGGSFVSGGYNHTGIDPGFGNPLLPSRPNWSGVSVGGFITTVVTLPPAGAGMPVVLRWRMGSDDSTAHTGWRIDDVSIATTVCGGSAPAVSSTVSRKTHGGAGDFDVNLPLVPLAGALGIEDRTGLVAGEHKMVVTFGSPVTVGGVSVTTGTGSVASSSVSGAVVTINLAGVTDAQRLGVTLSSVSDGTNLGSVHVPMGVLSGDTNANGAVNAGDAAQTKGQSGNPVGAGNFRVDVNSNGSINSGDVALVKSKAGNVLPP